MENIARELDYEQKSSMNIEEYLRHSKAWIQSVKWMKNIENPGLKHPHTSMKDHGVFVVRCSSKTQPNQVARKLNGGNV